MPRVRSQSPSTTPRSNKEQRAREKEARRQARLHRIIDDCKESRNKKGVLTRFPVLYADPPWQYEKGTAHPDRRIENHYSTMTVDDICDLPINNITTDDAILFLWSTNSHLPEALRVMAAWGFTYRTNMVWTKPSIGPGYYFRAQHEMLLVGKKGKMPVPKPGTQSSSVLCAPRMKHSAKPPEVADIIERLYPELPMLELFARERREGWAVWGAEVRSDVRLKPRR